MLNPQVVGMSYGEVKNLRLSEANMILDAITKSNQAIEKASKNGK